MPSPVAWRTALAGALLITACQAHSPPPWQPAIAPALSPAGFSELRDIIAAAVAPRTVRLNPDMFQTSPILVLEFAAARTPKGQLATGRTVTPPERFLLTSNGASCALEQSSTKRRWQLRLRDCQPHTPD